MTTKTIQSFARRHPFRPFTIRLANNQRIRITDPNRVGVHPEGKFVVIFEKDGGCRLIDIPLIAELNF
jgi:hypothetical protein